MIDPADKQTASLPLEQPKRGRGRPATGAALTPAQKQKAYRERIKSNVTIKDDGGELRLVKSLLEQALADKERLVEKVLSLEEQMKKYRHTIVEQARIIQNSGAVTLPIFWQQEIKLKGKRTWIAIGSPWEDRKAAEDWAKKMNEEKNGSKYRAVVAKAEE